MSDDWLIDEPDHAAGPEHLNAEFVAAYDRKQGFPDLSEDVEAFAAHGLDETATVVDLGAGTGTFALASASRFAEITAVDVSEVMLGVLARRASASGLTNIRCVKAGFLTYEHEGGLRQTAFTADTRFITYRISGRDLRSSAWQGFSGGVES